MATLGTRPSVLALYRRAVSLVGPYVESEGVKDFMKREFIRDLTAANAPKDEILKLQRQLDDTSNLVSLCKENVHGLFWENANETSESNITRLVSQGHIELDVIEKKIIEENRKFGAIKEGGNVRYVLSRDSADDG